MNIENSIKQILKEHCHLKYDPVLSAWLYPSSGVIKYKTINYKTLECTLDYKNDYAEYCLSATLHQAANVAVLRALGFRVTESDDQDHYVRRMQYNWLELHPYGYDSPFCYNLDKIITYKELLWKIQEIGLGY